MERTVKEAAVLHMQSLRCAQNHVMVCLPQDTVVFQGMRRTLVTSGGHYPDDIAQITKNGQLLGAGTPAAVAI